MNSVKERMKEVFFYCGLKKEDYQVIKNEIIEGNRQSLVVYSAFTCAAMVLCALFTYLLLPDYHNRIPVFLTAGLLLGIISVTASSFIKKYTEQIKTLCYAFAIILFASSLVLAVLSPATEKSVAYQAFVLVLPIMFIDLPIRIYATVIISDIAFVGLSFHHKISEVAVNDTLSCLVFSVIGLLICTYTVLSRAERFFFQAQVIVMSETDQLTGLKNRHYFEFCKKICPNSCTTSLACIYADANGLHQINNELGHEEGDNMLKHVAGCIHDEFGDSSTFRIGGDEFVALATDLTVPELESRIASIKQRVAEKNYNVAIGFSHAELSTNPNIDDIIKDAEKKMYQDKVKYYKEKDLEIRNHYI